MTMNVQPSGLLVDELNELLEKKKYLHEFSCGVLIGPPERLGSKVVFVPMASQEKEREAISDRLIAFLQSRRESHDGVLAYPRAFLPLDHNAVMIDNPFCFGEKTTLILAEIEEALQAPKAPTQS